MKLIDGWEIEKLNVSIPSKKAIDGVARKIVFDPIPQSVQDELDQVTGDVVDIVATFETVDGVTTMVPGRPLNI